MENKEENKLLLESFLNRTFFKDFSRIGREPLFDNLELMLSPKCNLTCSYCYYNHQNGFGRQLNPLDISKKENLLKNTDILLDYFKKNNMVPGKIDIFSGEPLNNDYTYEIINKCIDFYSDFDKKGSISIPSNMSFLRQNRRIDEIRKLKAKGQKHNVPVGVSASVDGLYMDSVNRQVGYAKNQSKFYNDNFYDRLFTFAKNVGCGFHPMVYHNNIEKWIDNFNWFQQNFKKYDLPWWNIYLLEVRNDGWTKKSIKEYIKFYKYVLNFAFKMVGSRDKFIKAFIFNGVKEYESINKMNMFNNIGKIGRGIGCSMQTTMFVRMGDLSVSSCHRQSYDVFNGFKFVENNGEIVDIEPMNLEYYMATISTDRRNWPYCERCLLKDICMSGCLGAQYETTGDSFTPIQSVCLLEHGKVRAQIEFLCKNNMFVDFLGYLPEEQAKSFEVFYKMLKKEKV